MDDPHALSRRTEDVFCAGVKLVVVDEAYVCAHIFVMSRQNDGKFCLVFNGRVDESTADADDVAFVDKRIVRDEGGFF